MRETKMATKNLTVEFVKRCEDRDKSGEKIVVPAGTRVKMTAAEVKKAGSKVRVIKDEQEQLDQSDDETGDGASGN
tara:strand:- start:100 stop:327 length:228 start_codon:yes stop_codon:yes gene_type:complete